MQFKNLLNKENPIIFEIGANDGTDTLKILAEFDDPVMHCFEPDEDTFKTLTKNINENTHKKVITNCVAISDTTGTADFVIADNTYSSSLKEPLEHIKIYPFVHFTHRKKVKTITLDEYAEENNISKCDLVWMDVQGAEDLVIAGGKKFFQNTKYLYTEFSNSKLYEGALNKEGILRLLPSFEIYSIIIDNYVGGDAIFVNTKFKEN